jgi:tetratricopeptide (TPR) repeat protein
MRQSVAGLFCVLLWTTAAFSQETPWTRYMAEAAKADQQGRFMGAEMHLLAAVKEAEGFGPEDPRLAASLMALALLYHAQGQYAEAEPLYKQALAIKEDVVAALENYADLLRKTNRQTEAEKMEARAKAIRAKQR